MKIKKKLFKNQNKSFLKNKKRIFWKKIEQTWEKKEFRNIFEWTKFLKNNNWKVF
jgi:hypothetical protein